MIFKKYMDGDGGTLTSNAEISRVIVHACNTAKNFIISDRSLSLSL